MYELETIDPVNSMPAIPADKGTIGTIQCGASQALCRLERPLAVQAKPYAA